MLKMNTFGKELTQMSEKVNPLKHIEQIELIVKKIRDKARIAAAKGHRRAVYILQEDRDVLNNDLLYHQSKEVVITFQNQDVILEFSNDFRCNKSCDCENSDCDCIKCDYQEHDDCTRPYHDGHAGYIIKWI
jgi:hypothetical protein